MVGCEWDLSRLQIIGGFVNIRLYGREENTTFWSQADWQAAYRKLFRDDEALC